MLKMGRSTSEAGKFSLVKADPAIAAKPGDGEGETIYGHVTKRDFRRGSKEALDVGTSYPDHN